MKILTIVLGVLLGLSLLANGTLAWLWINLAVSLDGSEVANRDCGTHRDSLDAVLRRVAHRRDIKEADSSQVWFQYASDERYTGSMCGVSATPNYRHEESRD